MPIEKTYYIPDEEDELIVKRETYFCYKCNAEQKIFFDNSPLKSCKCGCRTFYTI